MKNFILASTSTIYGSNYLEYLKDELIEFKNPILVILLQIENFYRRAITTSILGVRAYIVVIFAWLVMYYGWKILV